MAEVMTEATSTRRKALSILREGRLTVISARTSETRTAPFEAVFRVQGHRSVYAVDLAGSEWTCTCRDRERPCGHIVAAQLVAGRVAEVERRQAAREAAGAPA